MCILLSPRSVSLPTDSCAPCRNTIDRRRTTRRRCADWRLGLPAVETDSAYPPSPTLADALTLLVGGQRRAVPVSVPVCFLSRFLVWCPLWCLRRRLRSRPAGGSGWFRVVPEWRRGPSVRGPGSCEARQSASGEFPSCRDVCAGGEAPLLCCLRFVTQRQLSGALGWR